MDLSRFSAIDPNLRVGYNCAYMNISAILQYYKALSLALSYTNIDFVYNSERITKYVGTKSVKEYISPDNELIIMGDIGCVFHKDYRSYITQMMQSYNAITTNRIEFGKNFTIDKLKSDYLDKDIPIIFACDNYYLYDDYRKKSDNILRYHSDEHMATLFGIDENKQQSCIVDKFFYFAGNVLYQNFKDSIESDYISNFRIITADIIDLNKETETERLRNYLKKNIDITMNETVDINGNIYHKNQKALRYFINDFNDILDDIILQKGKYAPQFTTFLLQPVAIQVSSYDILMGYIQSMLYDVDFLDIKAILEKMTSLWLRIDYLCDKCYIAGKNIDSYRDKLLTILNEIYECHVRVLDKLELIRKQL